MEQATPILDVRNVSKAFVRKAGVIDKALSFAGLGAQDEIAIAVDGASFQAGRGEVIGIVGESGCGKSTLGRAIAGVLPPTSGQILYEQEDVYADCDAKKRLGIQLIFQDPFASLNPRLNIGSIIGEAARYHKLLPDSDHEDYVDRLMQQVGLNASYKARYPHQFSGGQRQRIGIARALAVKPKVLVCDEAVSALDVSIQAQILNLFLELQETLGLTYVFISHDLGVVHHVSDRLLVMYLGRVVESGIASDILADPSHPYTRALLEDLPRLGQRKRSFHPIKGEIPSPLAPPTGCHFHPRCPHAMAVCKKEAPPLREVAPKRYVACHLDEGVS